MGEDCMFLVMAQAIRADGIMTESMGQALKTFQMVTRSLANGASESGAEWAVSDSAMTVFCWDFTTRAPMVRARPSRLLLASTRVSGQMTCGMAWARRFGMTAVVMRGGTHVARCMVTDDSYGHLVTSTMGSGSMGFNMALEFRLPLQASKGRVLGRKAAGSLSKPQFSLAGQKSAEVQA